jgi:hypothetical protein
MGRRGSSVAEMFFASSWGDLVWLEIRHGIVRVGQRDDNVAAFDVKL